MHITESEAIDMLDSFTFFEEKMISAGLVNKGEVFMGFLDDEVLWNRMDSLIPFGSCLFDKLNINSIMIGKPAEPYRSVLEFLSRDNPGSIFPEDCETRTFFHDLPVVENLDPEVVSSVLKQRKCAVVSDGTIVTYGTVTLEQAFITFSSVCFAGFVKFFSDYLSLYKKGSCSREYKDAFYRIVSIIPEPVPVGTSLLKGPFKTEDQVIAAMCEAGKKTVEYNLVDSFFGNISFRFGDVLYISQTGSNLDSLKGCIDPCRLDGKSCAAITASSELGAHLSIISTTGCDAVLHGHPRFSVILSMACDADDCERGDNCYRTCTRKRDILGIPIVPGEIGSGPFGLCNTVPQAFKHSPAVLVYGHGLFAVSSDDFNKAFHILHSVENDCRKEYFRLAGL